MMQTVVGSVENGKMISVTVYVKLGVRVCVFITNL